MSRAQAKHVKQTHYDQFVPVIQQAITGTGTIPIEDFGSISQLYVSFKKNGQFVKDIVSSLEIYASESLLPTKDLLEINPMFQGLNVGNHFIGS
jgi:hypothetical protein